MIAADRLRAAGWTPAHQNEDTILDGLATLPARRSFVPAVLAGAASLLAAALLAAFGLRWRGKRKEKKKKRTPA